MPKLNFGEPILLIGSKGLLGSEIAAQLVTLESDSQKLDITERADVDRILREIRPSWVINAAAYTDVDKAEKERSLANQVNAQGPSYLAKSASSVGARLIHFSTDYVFSGDGEKPWSEEDPAVPRKPNWYGETKLLGEQAVLSYPEHLVVRVQWLYGRKRNRFNSLKQKDTFSPFLDQYGAPTWARDVARVLIPLMKQKASGLFHFSYDDFASWMDVYQFIKEEWKLKVKLEPRKTSDVLLPAARPLNVRLANQKLKKQLGVNHLGSWRDSLREFLRESQND